MPETKVQAPGTFCWSELAVANGKNARKFYGDLFGWTVRESAADQPFQYGMLQRDGREVGGIYEITGDMKAQGVPPHWMAYVAVRSADEIAAKVPQLGGKVMMGPADVMTAGRMAVLQDPTGAIFSVWQARDHVGSAVTGETGTPVWYELITSDKNEAGAFYAALFGWKLESFLGSMDYTILKNGEASVGGMMQRTEEMGEVPSHWVIYFTVDDADDAVSKAEKGGGRVLAGPMEIPNVGRFAVLADPDGAVFAVLKPNPASGDV